MTTYEILRLGVPWRAPRGHARLPIQTLGGNMNKCKPVLPGGASVCALPSTSHGPTSTANISNTKYGTSQEQQGSFLLTMNQHEQAQQKEHCVLREKQPVRGASRLTSPQTQPITLCHQNTTFNSPISLLF